MKRLLRLKDVQHAIGLSRSEIYRLIALKRFPGPISIGERAVAWTEDSINDWVQEKIEESARQSA